MIRRLFRVLTGHYTARRSRLADAIAAYEVLDYRDALDRVLQEIARDGDMQRSESQLLQRMEWS